VPGHHHIPVPVSVSGARELGSLLEGYIGYFLSSDSGFDTVVLVLEGFGAGVVERYVSKTQLERALERAARFDPAVWVYLPLLWGLGLGSAKRLMEELDRRAGIHMDRAVEVVRRSVAERRRLRLAALALASKHLIGAQEVQGYQGYLGLCTSVLWAAVGAAEKAYSDLDDVERALLLYLYEVANKIGESQAQPKLGLYADRILSGLSPQGLSGLARLAVAAVLYELARLGGERRKEYITKFYEFVSGVDLKGLAGELERAERESLEELKRLGMDEETAAEHAVPFADIVVASLVSLILHRMQDEFLPVPQLYFADFVSNYYRIPKWILKLSLSLNLLFYRIIKWIAKSIVFIVSLLFSLVIGVAAYFTGQHLYVAVVSPIVALILMNLLGPVKQFLEQLLRSWITKRIIPMRERAEKMIEELEYRKRVSDRLAI